MPHSYAQNVVHVIFSTKDRRKLLPKEFQPKLWAYVAGVCKNYEIHVDAIGGTEDHIHLLIRVPASFSIAKAILTIKSNSSKWVNEQGRRFSWQEGYAAFSVSASLVPRVARYINTQEAHHKRMTFDAEFMTILKKHGVKFDPSFMFG
jgi:REP element-mobilizing transposase RayT